MRLVHDPGAADDWHEQSLPAGPQTAQTDRAKASAVGRPAISPPDVIVHIYRPARSPMEAGRARARHWVVEPRPRTAPEIEPLMGWTASRDPLQQVRLTFPDRERAIAFAERQGWTPVVREPHEPQFRPKRYADNFRRPPQTKVNPRWRASRSTTA